MRIEQEEKKDNFQVIDKIIHLENPRESADKHLDQTQVHQYAKH